jgi:predicted CXXCH cytochrome family protein
LLFKALLLTAIAAVMIVLTVLDVRPRYRGVRAGRVDADYLKSKNCISCHTDHFASWARTFHSRMTQEARAGSVQGDFDRDNTFEYLGVKARMERRGGAFSMTLTYSDGRSQFHTIDRTVGSRRIEQYLTKQAGQYLRLPVAYDLLNRRWMSLNGSFFYPDRDNYFQHQTQWDSNCVFCHNVKAQPNMDPGSKRFDTEVTELGIACGACHGAAAEHAEAASSPLTRSLWRLGGDSETHIVNPSKLSPERSMMVCGHCHGQRVPARFEQIQEIFHSGDPYNAGDDLSHVYSPITRETRVGDYSFANRFWSNGSPRLTAYEYQGILRSRCFIDGSSDNRLNCLSCHSMHEGDPRGQITEENRTDKPCLTCHQEYQETATLAAHTGHKTDNQGSRCYNCHMPRVVYGVMSVHPTHDITVPDPRLTVTSAVPNACNQCHLDKSVNWSIESARRLWPSRFATAQVSEDAQFNLAEGPRALFAGDALIRAVAAEALGGGGPMKPDPRWAGPFLVEAFNDNYPIVRFFAANGLASGGWKTEKPDYLASPDARLGSINLWWAIFGAEARAGAMGFAEILRRKRVDVDIEVGE